MRLFLVYGYKSLTITHKMRYQRTKCIGMRCKTLKKEEKQMLEAYSLNVAVGENAAIPFNNVNPKKGCTAVLSGVSTIELNKAGIYMVEFDGTASASTTVQMSKDGVLQPQAQDTGTGLAFLTLVQVDKNNGCNCCSSPVTLRFLNSTAVTFTNCNVVVTKVC